VAIQRLYMDQATGLLRCALHEPLDRGCVLRRGVCIGSRRMLSPACGRRGPFQGGKGPKTPCAGRTPVRRHASPVPCGSRRMRAGTNSGIHALEQWCLAPAFGCDARRALRRVVALDRASLRYDSPVCETIALSTHRPRVHDPCAVPDPGTGRSQRRFVQSILKQL